MNNLKVLILNYKLSTFIIPFVLYLFCCIFIFNVSGQNTLINGNAKSAEGKTIYLNTYTDLITFNEKKIAQTVIDSIGRFTFNVNLPDVMLVYFSIDNFNSEFFAEPGKTYDVKLIVRHKTQDTSIKSDEVTESVRSFNIELLNSDNEELNIVIKKFDYWYKDFVYSNVEKLFNQRHKATLDSFRIKYDNEFKEIYNKYFKDYVNCRFGSLEFTTRIYSRESIEKKYFATKPLLYNNVAYMEFFNEFYSKYYTNSKNISLQSLDNLVNSGRGDYEGLLQQIKKDSLLHENLCELILLKELNDLYNITGYNKDNIFFIIREAAIKMKSETNKTIAGNLYKLLTKLKPGTKAPEFSLKSPKGRNINLKDLKGKYVYLCFCKTTIPSCLSELRIIQTLFKKYNNSIEFITVFTDDSQNSVNNFIKENKDYQWIIINNNDRNLLNDYNVKAYPTFVFISPDEYILDYPAPKPSEQIQMLFDKTLKVKSEK